MNILGEIGIKISWVLSLYAFLVLFLGIRSRQPSFLQSGYRAFGAIFLLTTAATGALVYALATKDFSLRYVAENVSSNLPLFYAVTALWAGQAGSLLFWAWLLALFTALVILQNRNRNEAFLPYVLLTLSVLQFFFLTLLVFPSNPFEPLGFTIREGMGLNPLLQNPGMIFHPPTLYLGYVGFAIPFSFAIAALLTRRLDAEWIRSTRRWTLFAWLFLSIGILLGAKWAYEELGWGGYWAWDPVENASLMPWLTGTAYLHSVMIQERKGMLKIWNMILIVVTFLLTILGTFITRSGMISSVHSFGASSLGPMFLVFLLAAALISFYLIYTRRHELRSRNRLDSYLSRESSFLFNNLILLGATFAVLWGTLFPLISEAVRGVKVTVGPPFFNQVNVPIGIVLILLTGICPLISWRKATWNNFLRNFLIPSGVFLASIMALFVAGLRNLYALLSFSLSAFVLATIFLEFYRGTRARVRLHGEAIPVAFGRLVNKYRRRYGGYIIHIGMILIFIGITGSSVFKKEKEVTLRKGDAFEFAGYRLEFVGIDEYRTSTAQVAAAALKLWKGDRYLGLANPSKHYHFLQEQTMTEVYIRSSLKEDLYLILAAIQKDGSVQIKAHLNPLLIWIWIGGYVVIFGTVIAIWPSRKKKPATAARKAEPAETVLQPAS
jgi:cytochrome c-type biogenesis protein CcmF